MATATAALLTSNLLTNPVATVEAFAGEMNMVLHHNANVAT
jgi:hypothetical protein